MSMCRRFHGARVLRLIVSVPAATVASVDNLLANRRHPAKGCRAEFVRLAIAEKLARDAAQGRQQGEGGHAADFATEARGF